METKGIHFERLAAKGGSWHHMDFNRHFLRVKLQHRNSPIVSGYDVGELKMSRLSKTRFERDIRQKLARRKYLLSLIYTKKHNPIGPRNRPGQQLEGEIISASNTFYLR